MPLEAIRLFHDLPFIGMAVTSPSSRRWIQVNQTLCDMLGYSRDDLMEKTWAELTHPDDLQGDVDLFESVLRGELNEYKLDKRFVRSDGRVVHASIDVKAIRDASGEITDFIATVADISARVEAERAARDAALLLQKLAQQVPGTLFQYQLYPGGRSRFPFASDALREVYEVGPEEVQFDASPVFARLHPDDYPRVVQSIQQSARTLETWHCDYRVILPQRGVRWLTGNARPERLPDDSVLWHGFIADTTEQQLAREALRKSEERFRIQVEHAPEAIVVYDLALDHFIDANRNAERLFGLTRAELLTRGMSDVTPAEQPDGRTSQDVVAEYVSRALAGEAPAFEWVHTHSTGREIPCEVHLVQLPFEGRLLLRSSMMDISERKAALDTLTRLQTAIDSSLNGVAMADLDGRISYANRAVLQIWGYQHASEVLGRDVSIFWRPRSDALRVAEALRRDGIWSGELTAVRPDNTSRVLRVNASLFRDSQDVPTGMLASFADITEEKRLQTQLLQAQKMESIGRLAGGVAHDFNNLLTVMKGYIELSLSSLREDSALRRDLLEVDHAANSAVSLTQQLLAFSRKQIISPVVLNLNDVLLRMQGMLQRLLGEDVKLTILTDASLAPVRFDPGQAEQVLVNLAANARDAMPNGGELTLETSNVTIDATHSPDHSDVQPGHYVRLAVSDTGEGMTDDIREHAFEPFFTTKDIGRGTGLGLAMIHGAVLQNGGQVEVYSEPKLGTSFKIYLPAVAADGSATSESHAASPPRGTETILLAEDDDTVRALARRLLLRQGYTVYDFSNGPAALHWIGSTAVPVHMLFTDVIMPEMNGKVLAEQVVALRPDIRVLFASGYTANVIVHHGVLKAGVEFLAKPYSILALSQKVRDVLDRPLTASADP